MASLILIEDHDILRRTLAAMLEREDDLTVIGVAASGEEGLELLENSRPDILLVDISMPGMDGIALLKQVQKQWPSLRCIILSGHAEVVYGQQARAAGAVAYIDKRNVREIVPAIRKVLATGQ